MLVLPPKEDLERQELQQRIRHGPYQLVATVLGAAAFLIAFGMDRCYSRRQQVWARSVSVVTEIDSLIGATRAAVASDEGRAVLVKLTVETMRERATSFAQSLDSSSVPPGAPIREELREFRAALDATAPRLSEDSSSLNEWADAAALQSLWRARALQPTPDFARLFGDSLLAQWQTLAEEANGVISARFSLLGDAGLVGSFDPRTTAFQRRLYDALEAQRP